MNYYALLPLCAFIANLLLGCYILYRDSKSLLNRLYCFFTFGLAIWALGDFLTFSGILIILSYLEVNVGTFGSALISAFLLHFCLIISKRKIISNKIFVILLYLPGLCFIFINQTTDLISGGLIPTYWGYTTTPGSIYFPFALYIIAYILIGFIFCYKYGRKTKDKKEKKQIKLIVIGISIPLIGGISTEVVPEIFGFNLIPLTTTLTTFTAVIIAYTIIKFGLMAPKSFSIRKKLIAIFLVFIISICTVSVFTVNTISRDTAENEIYAHLITTVQSRACHIESYLDQEKTLVKELALIGKVEKALLANKNDSDYNDKIEAVNKRLQKTVDSIEEIIDISIVDKSGIMIAGTNPPLYGSDKSIDPRFSKLNNGETAISEVKHPPEGGSPVLSIASPVKNGDEIIGFVFIRLYIQKLYDITLEDAGLGETGEVYLVNKDGYMITPSRLIDDAVLNQKVDSEQYRLCIIEHIAGSFLGEMDEVPTSYQDYRDVTVLGTHFFISETQWCLLAELDAEEAFAPVIMMQNTIIILFIIIATFSMIFTYFFAGSISKPIIKLKDRAMSISKGNFDTKIDIQSNDEIGELADAFINMAKGLKEQQENLEKTVAKRTKELNTKVDELQRFKKITVGRELKMVELKKKIKELEGGAKK